MAEEEQETITKTTSRLARHLDKVKKLHPEVTLLPDSYYRHIKYFLFGTNDSSKPLDLKSPPPGGVNAIISDGKLSPGKKVIIKVVSPSNEDFTVADITKGTEKDGDVFFFPSDLVSILTSLAELFYKGDGKHVFNQTGLSDFKSESDNLKFVRLWGQVELAEEYKQRGFIVEERFLRFGSTKVKQLFEEVKKAAEEYEKTFKKLDTTDFEPKSEVEKQLIADLIPKILEKYEKYDEKIKPNLDSDQKFKDADEKIQEEIEKIIKNDQIIFFLPLYSGDNLKQFGELGLFDSSTNSFLINKRSSDSQIGLLDLTTDEHDQYKKFAKDSVKKFLDRYSEELTKQFIDPLFVEAKEEEKKEEEKPTEAPADSGDAETIEEVKFDSPVDQETFRKKIFEDIAKQLVANFTDQFIPQYFTSFPDFKDKLPTSYLNSVVKEIKQQVEKNVTAILEIEFAELEELKAKNLYSDEKFNPEVLESDWYKELIQQGVQYITNSPSPESQYSSFFIYLFEKFVVPQIDALRPPEEPGQTPEPSGAVVPPAIPVPPITPEITVQTGDITRLSQEEARQLQYEAAWLYNRAVYELSTSNGRELTADELRALQASIYEFTAQMQLEKSGDFSKLFGSATSRQRALIEFYTKNGYIETIQNLYSGLSRGKTGKDQIDTLLQKSLKESLNIDSPVFTENVKNTIDTLIIQYGLNQDFYAFDPVTKTVTQYSGNNQHDILWFIDNVPIERLAIILNIPASALKNDPTIIAALKETLKKYARYRASELSLHIQNTSLQNGLVKISAEDAEKIKNGDEQTIAKHLSFTGDLRNLSQKHGSDTVAAALDEKPDKNKEKILKQYKTFIPLWNQLTGSEQKLIYERYGIPVPRDFDPEIKKLDFIPEFILFDPSQLKTVKEIAESSKLNEQEKLELLAILEEKKQLEQDLEIAEIIAQYRREQELAYVLNNEFTNNSDLSELQEISNHTGENYDDLSYFEKFAADQEIQDGGSTEYEVAGAGGGLASRFSNSKLGKRLNSKIGKTFKKKLSPTDKTKKAANKAIEKTLSAVASKAVALIPGVGTAASAALLAMKNKVVREFVSGAILGGLAFLIGRTIWALGSIGGFIGGVIGGVVGAAVGGPAGAIAGVVTGANIGQAIMPQRWDSLAAGRGSTVITAVPPKLPESLEGLLGNTAGIGILAVGGFAFMGTAITFFTIFTIQSSFLIPVPSESMRKGSSPNLPPGQSLCWPTSGYLTQVDVSGHEGLYKVNGITQAIDVGCGETANCPDSNGENVNPPAIYASHDGIANIISIRDGYGLHIIIQSPQGYRTIYAHMSSTILPSGTTGPVSRGDLLGYMGATGNSIDQHLHYEYSGGLIRDILPSTPTIPPTNQIPGGTLLQIPVAENCSTGGELPTGFMAIGPQTPGNIVTTDSSLVSTPQIVCSWKDSQGLAAAINGNFYNSPTVPIGFGGSNPTKYYANAANRGGPEYMGFNMRSLIVNQSGIPSIIKIDQQWYNAGSFPIDAPQYSHAVTGLSEFTSDDGDRRQKTAIGLGEASGKCGTFTGEAVFLGAIQQGEWSDLKKLMQYCGATEFVFMDAGGSASFCSDTLNLPSTRPMPVNVGLKNAEIIKIGQ